MDSIKKSVLITGCSTGIGRETAIRLSRAGYRVAATARKPETLSDIPAELKLQLDVTSNESIAAAVAETVRNFGRIDVLVNNAGFGVNSAVEEIPEDTLKMMYDVNVYGVIRMIKAVAPLMRGNKSGLVINIGSIVGRSSIPVNGLYSSTKYAVEALSDALRLEMAAFGIRVVLIEPGHIETSFHDTVNATSGTIINNTNSIYCDLYKNFIGYLKATRRSSTGPEAVSSVIRRAIKARRPAARYLANVPFAMKCLLSLGDRPKDLVLKTALKIKPPVIE